MASPHTLAPTGIGPTDFAHHITGGNGEVIISNQEVIKVSDGSVIGQVNGWPGGLQTNGRVIATFPYPSPWENEGPVVEIYVIPEPPGCVGCGCPP